MELSAEKAVVDFNDGKFRFYCKGTAVAELLPITQYLRERFHVTFCLLADSTPAYEKYSARMQELLRVKFGVDVFNEAEDETGVCIARFAEWPPSMVFSLLNLFADHGSYLWDRNGTSMDLEEILGRPEPLDQKLEEWAYRYSSVADIDDQGKWFVPCSPEELRQYNEEGLALAREARKLLPETTMLYYSSVLENAFWDDCVEVT